MGEADLSVTTKITARAIFLGAPGAGKGTQAHRLAQDTGTLHISTGDMLRQHVADGTKLGGQAKTYMTQGQLVPDEIIIAMVSERIALPDAGRSWVLDGFPRTLPQAQALDSSLAATSAEGTSTVEGLTHAIYFQVPRSVLVRRLSGRRTCSKCGAIWHVDFNPTVVEGICDSCTGVLTQRADDRPDAIGKRLEDYSTETEPLLGYYRNRDLLNEINANRAPELVYGDLIKVLQ